MLKNCFTKSTDGCKIKMLGTIRAVEPPVCSRYQVELEHVYQFALGDFWGEDLTTTWGFIDNAFQLIGFRDECGPFKAYMVAYGSWLFADGNCSLLCTPEDIKSTSEVIGESPGQAVLLPAKTEHIDSIDTSFYLFLKAFGI